VEQEGTFSKVGSRCRVKKVHVGKFKVGEGYCNEPINKILLRKKGTFEREISGKGRIPPRVTNKKRVHTGKELKPFR